MGSYTFKWEHPADHVFVTGTFDNWTKSIQLEKKDGIFQKTVELPKTDEKVIYKFVVDDKWVTNDNAPTENDEGNINNFLMPADIAKTAPVTSSAAPESTTAALAAAVPKEAEAAKDKDGPAPPGAFPETPFETPAGEPQQFAVNPIPATEGPGNPVHLKPGEPVPDPSTLTSNTIASTVEADKDLKKPEEPTFSVNPIAATEGLGNPIKLAPGEAVPDAKELSKKDDAAAAPNGMFGVPPVTGPLIPESSLPVDGGAVPTDAAVDAGPTIQSAAPISTTAALAAAVPKEPRGVPEVVTESQKEAHVSPEASANPEAVVEKSEVEAELKKEVPEAPPAAESGITADKAKEIAAGAVAGIAASAGAFAAATYAAKDKAAAAIGLTSTSEPAAAVPEEVKESIEAAHVSPEAAANPEAVAEKAAVEAELKKEVPVENQTGEPAPKAEESKGGLSPDALGSEPLKSSQEEIAAKPTVLSVEPTTLPLDSRDVSPMTKTPGKEPEAAPADAAAAPAAEETKAASEATEAKTSVANGSSSAGAAVGAAVKTATKDEEKERKRKHRVSGFFKKLFK